MKTNPMRVSPPPALTPAFAAALIWLVGSVAVHAQQAVPQFINFQGKIAVSGTNFTGTGGFEFALVSGTTTYWSSGNAEVPIPVSQGIYTVLLGNPALTNMAAFGNLKFNGNTNLFLRVWFDDGVHGLQQLSPDQQVASVPFSLVAGSCTNPIPHLQVFNTTGTSSFTVPSGVSRIMVEAWGAGAGGGGGGCGFLDTGGGGSGGGGGGGGYAKDVIGSLVSGSSVTVMVGAGGTGGAGGTSLGSGAGRVVAGNGGNGGTSGVMVTSGTVLAYGGIAGTGGTSADNGDSSGGGNGVAGLGGYGFASIVFQGGGGGGMTVNPGVGAGGPTLYQAPGSGGGGGPANVSGTANLAQGSNGSNGAQGMVVIWW